MWSRNEFSERLNLEWPILSAPMGEFTTPALASAVSNAGALGGLGMFGFSAEDAERRIAGFRQQSGGSLNVNYLLWEKPTVQDDTGLAVRHHLQSHYDAHDLGAVPLPRPPAGEVSPDHLEMLGRAKPEVLSFHFGLPDDSAMEVIKSHGIYIICSATTTAEARLLEARGVDAIIAQGAEAGGHRGTFTGVDISQQPGGLALIPQVVDAVSIPVIAAGGIADGRGIAAAIMLGASGVQLGTAFLGCDETNIQEVHRDALAHADDTSTVVTPTMTGKPARMIRTRLIDELSALSDDILPFPAQYGVTKALGGTGRPELAALFSGQAASLTRAMPAGELVATLAEETTRRLKAFG